MKTAGDVCKRDVIFVQPQVTLVQAAQLMREHHVGCLVVARERQGKRVPVGLVTDRDIVVGVVALTPSRLEQLTVEDVLVDPVVTVREKDGVFEALERMRGHGIRRTPVVDAQGTLVGILSADDILEFVSHELKSLADLIRREQVVEQQSRP